MSDQAAYWIFQIKAAKYLKALFISKARLAMFYFSALGLVLAKSNGTVQRTQKCKTQLFARGVQIQGV